MKLTKTQLKRIIKEELGQIMGEEEQLTLPGVAPEADTDSNSLMYSAFSYIDSKLDQNPELSGPDGDPSGVMQDLMRDHHFSELMQTLFKQVAGSPLFGKVPEDVLLDTFEDFVGSSSEERKAFIKRNIG